MSLLLDAKTQRGLSPHPLHLSAANASSTVRLGFAGVLVGDDRFVRAQPLEVVRQQGERLRLNGSFALGVARRCCLLIGPSPLDDELARPSRRARRRRRGGHARGPSPGLLNWRCAHRTPWL